MALPPGAMTFPVHGADRLLLRVQKGLHPSGVQDLLEQRSLPLLDHQIHVQKAVAQGLGQKNAHGTFPGAGHAD